MRRARITYPESFHHVPKRICYARDQGIPGPALFKHQFGLGKIRERSTINLIIQDLTLIFSRNNERPIVLLRRETIAFDIGSRFTISDTSFSKERINHDGYSFTKLVAFHCQGTVRPRFRRSGLRLAAGDPRHVLLEKSRGSQCYPSFQAWPTGIRFV